MASAIEYNTAFVSLIDLINVDFLQFCLVMWGIFLALLPLILLAFLLNELARRCRLRCKRVPKEKTETGGRVSPVRKPAPKKE